MGAIPVSQNNFEQEVLKSTTPVLVDFWAEWCGPCRAIAPVLEELAGELKGKIKIAKVNVDDEQELAAKFNIMSIPTLLLFKNGKIVEQIVGALHKLQLSAKINPHLS